MSRSILYSRVDDQDTKAVEQKGWLKWLLLFWNVLLLLLVAALASQVWQQNTNQECRVYPESGARIDQWPHTLKPTLFLANNSFATGAMWSSLPHLERVLANWIPLSPLSRGLISLSQSLHPTHDPPYLLDPLDDDHAKLAYVLSAPHQLHCLSTIMHSYGKLWNGRDEGYMADYVAHCFDYLRQGVMCAGDVTVEENASWRFPGGKVEPPWGIVHMCRDWEAVRRWAEERGVWEFPEGSGLL